MMKVSKGLASLLVLLSVSLAHAIIPEGYRNFSRVQSDVKKLERQFPQRVKTIPYGKSQKGNPLFAVKISDNVEKDENEPQILITAGTHGDELITVEVILGLMEKLLKSKEDPRLQKIISNLEIYFIPVVNPDGYLNQERLENGADPNLSYPYPNKPNNKPTPSIKALIQFYESKSFVGSLDFHAYSELIMYPWSYSMDSIDQDQLQMFDDLARRMAEKNNYSYGQISRILYTAEGSSVDYYYWKKKTKAFAIEIGRHKSPIHFVIPKYTEEVTDSTWVFLEHFQESSK